MDINIKNYTLKYLIFCILLFFIFYLNKINEFPSHIHVWTQSDRYAIALGFIDNNFDLLHPQTFNLRPNPDFEPQKETGITPVDFPIHEFNIAILMKILGTRSPWVFKVYILIYGLIGVYLIGLLVYKTTHNKTLGIFFSGFIITCPVFTYYLAGFLPTITSLSSFFIAIYFYTNYLIEKRKVQFVFSIFFFTLAALSRTPYNIFLLAVVLTEILLFIKNKKFAFYKVVCFVISYTVINLYFIHNHKLSLQYGSGFLNTFLTPDSIKDFFVIIQKTLSKWGFHYFTFFQYVFIVFSIWLIIKNNKKISLQKFQKELILLFIIGFTGALIYSILMAKQFLAHDYYFYDSSFPVLILPGFLFITIISKLEIVNHKLLICFGQVKRIA